VEVAARNHHFSCKASSFKQSFGLLVCMMKLMGCIDLEGEGIGMVTGFGGIFPLHPCRIFTAVCKVLYR